MAGTGIGSGGGDGGGGATVLQNTRSCRRRSCSRSTRRSSPRSTAPPPATASTSPWAATCASSASRPACCPASPSVASSPSRAAPGTCPGSSGWAKAAEIGFLGRDIDAAGAHGPRPRQRRRRRRRPRRPRRRSWAARDRRQRAARHPGHEAALPPRPHPGLPVPHPPRAAPDDAAVRHQGLLRGHLELRRGPRPRVPGPLTPVQIGDDLLAPGYAASICGLGGAARRRRRPLRWSRWATTSTLPGRPPSERRTGSAGHARRRLVARSGARHPARMGHGQPSWSSSALVPGFIVASNARKRRAGADELSTTDATGSPVALEYSRLERPRHDRARSPRCTGVSDLAALVAIAFVNAAMILFGVAHVRWPTRPTRDVVDPVLRCGCVAGVGPWLAHLRLPRRERQPGRRLRSAEHRRRHPGHDLPVRQLRRDRPVAAVPAHGSVGPTTSAANRVGSIVREPSRRTSAARLADLRQHH